MGSVKSTLQCINTLQYVIKFKADVTSYRNVSCHISVAIGAGHDGDLWTVGMGGGQ